MAYLMFVADDFAAKVLRDAGHEVHVELDTKSAVEGAEAPRPVILDAMFPEDSSAGFELARTMKHYRERLKDIPILMLAAAYMRFSPGFGTRDIDDTWLPVTNFGEKPLDFDVLKEKVALLRRGTAA